MKKLMYKTHLAGATRKKSKRHRLHNEKVEVPNSPRQGHQQKFEMAPRKVEMGLVYTMVKLMNQTRVASSKRGAQKVNAKG